MNTVLILTIAALILNALFQVTEDKKNMRGEK